MSEILAQLEKKGGGGELKRVVIATSQNSKAERTFNVKNILPNDYSKLTKDNFALVNVRIYYDTGGEAVYSFMPTSYNATTGVLTCGASYTNGGGYRFFILYDVVCYY